MTEVKCEYCGSFQTNKYDLKRHQQTKKCILAQQLQGIQVDIPSKCCDLCGGSFSIRYIKDHVKSCQSKTGNVNNNIHVDNNSHIENVNIDNSVTNNTTNNITNNITLDFGKFFTDEKIAQIFQDYKSEHALEQMKGLAKFIIEKMLLLESSPGYYVRDFMRNIFAYDTDDGIKYDDNGELLRQKIKDGAGDYINEIVDSIIHNFGSLHGKKNEEKVEDMKGFKKDIRELNITGKLMTSIKKDYRCKTKDQRNERISKIKESNDKAKVKSNEIERLKKLEEDKNIKIKQYKFNLDKDRKDYVLSKGMANEPLSYTDKPVLEELGLKYTDFFLEEL